MTLPVWLAPFSPLATLARTTGRTSDNVAQRLGKRTEQPEFGRNQSALGCVTLLLCFSTSSL